MGIRTVLAAAGAIGCGESKQRPHAFSGTGVDTVTYWVYDFDNRDMKGPILLLALFFVVPASAQNLTSAQTECTHVKSDSTRPQPTKPNETKIGNLVCHQGVPNPTPAQPRLKLGQPPADHSVVPKIDSPPPVPVKTAFINPGLEKSSAPARNDPSHPESLF
jgi:hypothetical protein